MREVINISSETTSQDHSQRPITSSSQERITRNHKGKRVKLCDEFWDDFMAAAKVVYLMNREATLYDVFNHIRVEYNGGHNNFGDDWNQCPYTEDGSGCLSCADAAKCA